MTGEDGYFDEPAAATSDDPFDEMFEPAVVNPTVDFLAELAGTGRALELGGCFVIEVGVPELRRLPPGQRFVVFGGRETHWGIDEYDVANQGLISHHF